MTLMEISESLRGRGIALNPPLDLNRTEWRDVSMQFLNSFYIEPVYCCFDGFEEGTADDASMISIWSVRKIISEAVGDSEGKLVVGDVLIYSDFVVVGDQGQVYLMYENRLLAESFEEFLQALCAGKFDIAKGGGKGDASI